MSFRSRTRRFVALGAGALAVAVLASACGSSVNDAATVGSTHVSRKQLQEDLHDLASSKRFVKLVKSNAPDVVVGRDAQSIDARLAASWLTRLVEQAGADKIFADHHLTLTAQDRTSAANAVQQLFTDQQGSFVSELPKRFVKSYTEREARLLAVENRVKPTLADARTFYETNKDSFFPCASKKRVAHIVLKTFDDANLVLAQARGGLDFATLAKQRSIDTATAQNGGVISSTTGQEAAGCFPADAPAELAAAVKNAKLGYPTGPIQTRNGYEVILVAPFAPPTFEQIASQLMAALQQPTQQTAQTILQALLSSRLQHVKVDPRYGKWSLKGGPHVEPPVSPTVRTARPKSAAPGAVPLGGLTTTSTTQALGG